MRRIPKVLIGCECSGIVRNAFLELGFDAWSCDLLPAEDGSNRHIRGDVRDLLARDRMPSDLPRPQIVQPHWFGHPEYKGTGWYLRGLDALKPTDKITEPEKGSDEWKRWNRVWRMSPGADRGKERSRFFPGMARACAAQWGVQAMMDMMGVAA